MKNAFIHSHPVVNLCYFLLVLGFGMFCMHPLCLTVSMVCALCCVSVLRPRKKALLLGMLPVVVLTAVINPLFVHEGATILWFFPGGNPLTLESICYGLAAGFMLASVVLWFSCCNAVITSDKFVYLFGRVAPALSLVLSMTLGFLPRFLDQFEAVRQAQNAIGKAPETKREKLRSAFTQISILITWSLENALDTADSMRSRGYGLKGRKSFSIYTWTRRDLMLLLWILGTGLYLLIGAGTGHLRWEFYPLLSGAGFSPYTVSLYICYALLCLTPALFGLWEERKWHCLQSKI